MRAVEAFMTFNYDKYVVEKY